MSLAFTSLHKFHNEDFILDYFIRDWRVYPEKPGDWKIDHTRKLLAHALGFEGWDPLTEMDTGYFPDEVVYELLEERFTFKRIKVRKKINRIVYD